MKQWFSIPALAAEKLPGIPHTQQGLSKRARVEQWDRTEHVRQRSGRGAGIEYHYSLLPEAAQTALLTRYQPANDPGEAPVQRAVVATQEPPGAAAWGWYDAQPDKMKNEAKRRLEALARIEELRRRAGRAAAVRTVADEQDVSVATIRNWLERVQGVPRADWLPALVPAPRGGGGQEREIQEEVWEAFKADYLRLAQPSLRSCYRRLERLAEQHGWELPPERTLRRRVDAIPEAVRVLARQGTEAAKKLFPAQKRDRSMLHAMEAVNADGHKWDVFVRWPDGKIGRPVMLAFQDLYSGKFLSWRYGQGENRDMVRLAFGDMCLSFGLPDKCLFDNGKAFASKWLTGGMPNRYRFKVKPEEPLGILTQLGVEVHWATPYAGQSKPIERGFRDFCDDIARGPWFQGAYTGNTPLAKPEDYATRAIPFEEFKARVDHEIMMHNQRPGRESQVCGGKLSFNQAFDASYATALVRRASPEQVRICLLAAEGVRAHARDGAIHLLGNRYWSEALLAERGNLLTVRFDPDNLHTDLPTYRRDGTLVCVAALQEAAGFFDTAAARKHAQARNSFIRAQREMLAAERTLSLSELVALHPKVATPEPAAPEPVRSLFQGSLAVKPAANAEDDDDFDLKLARGRAKLLRAVED